MSGGSDGKESACNVEDLDLFPGLGISPGGGHSNPFQYSCMENSHGQRCLPGYRLWGHRESDTTKQLSTAQHMTLVVGLSYKGTITLRDVCSLYACFLESFLNHKWVLNLTLKWSEDLNSHFLKRFTDCQQAHEKMVNITNHWRNTN